MEKIQLVVLGLSASPANNNAYALILKESEGERRLPIIIGAFEAQAIALEMEGVMPPRPMTHDLIRTLLDQMGATLSEVYINDLVDGTFYAKLIFDSLSVEIDCRPSDAIAIAVRTGSPIFVSNEIMDQTGLIPQSEDGDEFDDDDEEDSLKFTRPEERFSESNKPKSKIDEIQSELDKAVKDEDYEKAAKLRDELKRILESQ